DIPSMKDAGDIQGLLRLLSHPDPDTRWKAAEALGSLGEQALEDLLGEVDHHDPEVRLGVIEALGEIGDPRAVRPLLAILAGDPDGEIRWATALALGNLGGTHAIPGLVNALGDPDKYVRFGAAVALETLAWEPDSEEDRARSLIAKQEWSSLPFLGTPATLPLAEAARDRDPAIRARAVETLGEIGDPRGAGACGLVLRDPDSGVRWRATLASPGCGIPPMHLPLGLARRPRTGKSASIAALLNLFFLGLGYSYLDRWYGLVIFQLNLTAVVLASLVVGPLLPSLASYSLSAAFAVQTWFSARRMAEGGMG
ncbi:MAG TPA: HEAT repeat domain-containing protein, partial [Methanomicrobiales archaeon]|nr:HEAT repeat domain-containing protein [Methanomicrobiales archaeon]